MKVKCKMVGNNGQRRPVKILLYHSCERLSALQLSSKLKLGGLLPLRISPTHMIKMCLKNWIQAMGQVGNMNYSSSRLPIRGHMRSSRCLDQL